MFCLHWVFVAACMGFSLVAMSRGYSTLWCMGFSLQWLLLLRIGGSRAVWASVVVSCGLQWLGSWALEHRLNNCGTWGASLLCGMWDLRRPGIEPVSSAGSLPLSHQGSL